MSEEFAGFESAEDLIGYCEIHCETPRALFHTSHINAMFRLARVNDRMIGEGFYSMHGQMKSLCRKARARLNIKVVPS